ncbi:MAG: outer membrane lipid asymmetry maintenance protein MlaD [Acetobacteraceae bacterium]|nr:outer membrane lipid asymmetry maintenance protein MlaD [Acetobacteraceae bacterium]
MRRSALELLAGGLVLLAAAAFLAYALAATGRSVAGPGITLTARFERIDGITPGTDVRLAGVRVGSVVSQRIDPETFLAVVTMRVDAALRLPEDSSAEITTDGLFGGRFVALVPGGAERRLGDGDTIRITQSAISLEALIGRFMFSGEGGGSRPAGARP